MMRNSRGQHPAGRKAISEGFSLIELIVAMSVFLVVGAASLSLYSRHETLLNQEQGVAGLNIGLRNALSQLQIDVVNAGNGLILGANVPAWPVGVTIVNSNPTTTTCNPTATNPATYQAPCFDQLNVVMVDPNTPAMQPTNLCTGPLNTNTSSTLTASVPLPYYANSYYKNFKTGDQILFVTSTGAAFTTALLTTNGTCPGCSSTNGFVTLNFTSTGAGGTNTVANDPLSITVNAPATSLTSSFCSTDWILRLQPIQYSVSVANPSDPQLMRAQGGASSVLMDQVIGFKVGAAWWNNNTSTFAYCYNTGAFCDPPTNSVPGYNGDFTLVRAVRISIIGRTAPSTDPTYKYVNPFDSGHYQIRGSSIIVNPRNLTMNND